MQRIVRGLSATLSHTFYSDGVATDPSPATATVTITRDDGTAVVTAQAATRTSAGVFTYTITPAENALLDTLTVAWTATFGGQAQTFTDTVEVAGGVLFTIAQAQAQSGLATKTAAEITAARTYVEAELEQACGVAFVPRYSKVTLSGNGRSTLLLPPRTTAIRSVSLDGVAVAQSYLDTMRLLPSGELYYPSWWSSGYGNYVVAFEHGYSDGAERMAATQAALTWAKSHLVSGPIDDRATQQIGEFGTVNLATPGMFGSVSGIPAVDSFIKRYSLNVCVA
jgi:hypothetical protein